MRTAAKRDANESAIIDTLRLSGATVQPLSAPGVPDLLVGYHGQTYLIEVKNKYGALTADQEQFLASWDGGHIYVVRTIDDALVAIGAVK